MYGLKLFLLIAFFITVIDGYSKMEEVSVMGEKKEDCARVRKDLNDQKTKTMCKPRMALVKLKTEPGYTYFPNVVSVYRCHGFCYNDISCIPVVSNYTSVIVKRQHISSSRLTCHRIDVEEHKECKCLCSVMKEHCKKNQIYDEDECECKCTNMEAMRKCNTMPHRRWNPETCSCMCNKQEEECTTGLQWIPKYCKCLRVMGDTHDNEI